MWSWVLLTPTRADDSCTDDPPSSARDWFASLVAISTLDSNTVALALSVFASCSDTAVNVLYFYWLKGRPIRPTVALTYLGRADWPVVRRVRCHQACPPPDLSTLPNKPRDTAAARASPGCVLTIGGTTAHNTLQQLCHWLFALTNPSFLGGRFVKWTANSGSTECEP